MDYSFHLAARVLLYIPSTDRMVHITAFVTPVVEHWLEQEIAQWVHHEAMRDCTINRHSTTKQNGFK